jgi:hypothetical protein
MILLDSSVWIDFFKGLEARQTDRLDNLLGQEPVLIGDLLPTEVLQGFRHDADYRKARALLDTLELRPLGGRAIALAAADNYRRLRRLGVRPRKTIDMIIATYCVAHGLKLLHADKDFEVLEKELGLTVVGS